MTPSLDQYYALRYQGKEGVASSYIRSKLRAMRLAKLLAVKFGTVAVYGPRKYDARKLVGQVKAAR